MRAEEKERLIQGITREVLRRLQPFLASPPQITASGDSSAPADFLNKRLITLKDVQALKGETIHAIRVSESTIITAAALDYLKELQIKPERVLASTAPFAVSNEGNARVAILAPALYRFQWQALQSAVERCGYTSVRIEAERNKISTAIPTLLQGIHSGSYRAAIFMAEEASTWVSTLRQQEKIVPVIGWDVLSVSLKQAPQSSNLLLIHQNTFGVKKLSQLITAWLAPLPVS